MKILHFFLFLSVIYFSLLATSNHTFATNASISATIDYSLTYPGILPDHPVYKLKVLRDKIIERFASTIEQKIIFYLRQADKGIWATDMLINQKKFDLAAETALKTENNFTMLSEVLKAAPQKLDPELFKKIQLASLKHQEVLQGIIKRVPSDKQKTFKDVLYFSKINQQNIEKWQTMKQKNKKK